VIVLAGAGSALALSLAYFYEAGSDGRWVMVFGVAFVLTSGWVALRKPSQLPVLFVAYLPFAKIYPFLFAGGGLNMTNAILGLGLAAWIAARFNGRPNRPRRALGVLLMIFLCVGLGGLLTTAANEAMSTTDLILLFKRWSEPMLFYFIVYALVEDQDDVKAVVLCLLWSTLLIAALTWLDGISTGRRGGATDRIGGILRQPNDMGAFLVYYGVPFLAFAVRLSGMSMRLILASGFLVTVRAMLMTFSRGAYLALAAGTGAILAFGNPFLLAFAATGGAYVYFRAPQLLPGSVVARMSQTERNDSVYYDDPTAGLDASSRNRLILWDGAISIMREHTFRGVGLGRFHTTVEDYVPEKLEESGPRDAHNAYLLTGAELGVPGLALMISLLVGLGASGVRLFFRRSHLFDRAFGLALLGTIAAVATSCMFGSRFYDTSLVGYLWVMGGLASSLLSAPLAAPEGSHDAQPA